MSLPPGPAALFAIPTALRILKDPRRALADYARRYGPVWHTLMPRRGGRLVPLVWLLGPAGNERILAQKYKDDFCWYEGYNLTMEPLIGRDILVLLDDTEADAAHRTRYRILQPAFHARLDGDYVPLMLGIMRGYLDGWRPGDEIDLAWEVKRIAFHVVAALLLGARDEDLTELTRRFEELGLALFSPFKISLPGTRFYRGKQAAALLRRYVGARIAAYREGGELPRNLLGNLMRSQLDSGEGIPDETLVAEMIAMLFVGYDTTASMLTSLFVCLEGRQDVYQQVRGEARALGALTAAAMQEQQVLEAALLETERMHPPLTFAMRGVVRDFQFGGYDIPKGGKVAYSAHYTGRMSELFPRPDEFLPERFLNGQKAPPYAILGFGGGHRSCIGKRFSSLEMRLFVNLLLQRFDLEFIPGQPGEVFFNPTLQRRAGYRVRLRRPAGDG